MKFVKLAALVLFTGVLGAKAFVLNFNSFGNPRHWDLLVPDSSISTNVINTNTHAIRYFLASDGYSATNTAAELNLVRAAFAQWQAVPGTYLKFEDAGLVTPPVDVNTSDNTNIVYWTKTSTIVNGGFDDIGGALGVAFTRFTTTDNKILQADIVFNGFDYPWFANFFDTNNMDTYVEGVALHEIGHLIGLNHSPVGGATMLYAGGPGLNLQTGLSNDDSPAARHLYPTAPTNFGAVQGTITKSGSPVFGAAVFARNAVSNVVAGTVTLTNGTYRLSSLSPGSYQIRVAPLDDSDAVDFLCRGRDIAFSFNTADTMFLPTTNIAVTVTAGNTNTADFAVTAGSPAYRITHIRTPTPNPPFSYDWGSLPTSMRVGQSNYTIGVASADLPTSGVTLTITGDGLTLGAVSSNLNAFDTGLNFWSVPISVSSNATPGLRDFILQQGTNIAYANGFLEIQPASFDYNFDGLDDAFQRQYFSLFTSTQAAPNSDPDGDGMNNSGEYVAGTIPTNAASVLKMLVLTNAPSGTTVRWQSVVGKKYQVSSRTNLTTATWQNIGSVVTATNTTAQYFDPTATNGMRYYRAQVLP